MPIGRACSSFLQSPTKLQDPSDFCIPCCIGDIQIERALCDLGASVSLMPLSLYRRLMLLDRTPTPISIQLVDCSIRQPAGILENLPVRVKGFVVPCDFFVVDMEESPHIPLILGRRFHPLQRLYLQPLLTISSASRYLMKIETPTCGLPGMLILCRSQLVLGSLCSYWGGTEPHCIMLHLPRCTS